MANAVPSMAPISMATDRRWSLDDRPIRVAREYETSLVRWRDSTYIRRATRARRPVMIPSDSRNPNSHESARNAGVLATYKAVVTAAG